MEFYSYSRPDLICPKMKRTVQKLVKKECNPSVLQTTINSVVETIKTTVLDNKMMTFIIVATIVASVWRYIYVKNRREQFGDSTHYRLNESELLSMLDTNQSTSHLEPSDQPTLNPLYPVSNQQQQVNYLPNSIPVKLKGDNVVPNIKYSKQYNNLIDPEYEYTNPSGSYYTGTYDAYSGQPPSKLVNPYGFTTDFNLDTGQFVRGVVDKNVENLIDYQLIADRKTKDAYYVEPPYSDV